MKTGTRASERDLRHLARLHGVQVDLVDGTGVSRRVASDTLIAVLRCLGTAIEGPADAAEALQRRRLEMRGEGLPSTIVGDAETSMALPLRGAAEQGSYRLWLRTEAGEEQVFDGKLEALPSSRGGPRLPLPLPQPGVHQLLLECGDVRCSSMLLSRPRPAPVGPPRWGAFLPLQLLGRPDSKQVGGLDRLAAAAEWLADLGGSFLGSLPALAASRSEPSPYSPLSRCFWNEAYLGAGWLPGGCADAATSGRGGAAPESSGRESLPSGREIDLGAGWRAADANVDAVLRWLSSEAGADGRQHLQSFAARRPRLRAYAAYRALAETHGEDWRAWPSTLAERPVAIAAADPARARWHLVAQWLASQQWQQLASTARARGVDLYLDLPLGVPAASFDAWWWREELVSGCSIGAPPDRFFPEGQDWGLAPPHPRAQARAGYGQLRAALQHHLAVARLLRIDHVMGLHRLYWVPAGASPHEGTYVRYPAAELHAIHAIEAWRRGATLVGEDLGTVPTSVRERMREHGMRRMWIALAELGDDPSQAFAMPVADSLASLSTHDMPTFCGFWTDADIHRRAALGRLPQHRVEADKAAREPVKQALMRFLEARGVIQGYAAPEIAAACLRWLAESPAELLVVSPEDLEGETTSLNIPGAPPPGTTAAANWLRGSPGGLERWRADAGVTGVLRELDARRKRQGSASC